MTPQMPTVTTEEHDGLVFQVLREPSTESEAWILPEVGANCVRFVTSVDGHLVEVIRLPDSWDAFHARPTFHGAAVLFPFPGRIRGGRFSFAGKTHQLELNEPDAGNAIHGCVARQPWSQLETSADEAGASITYGIGMDSRDELLELYPFPFRLNLSITLRNGHLIHGFAAENLGSTPMPIGLGLHPYFPLPLGNRGEVDECEIWIDAPYFWDQQHAIPTGDSRRAEESLDLRTPRSLRALASIGIGGPDRMLNVCYSQFSDRHGPRPTPHGIRCGVRNPRSGCEVVVEPSSAFSACVAYVPPSRDKISFEPHTCVPNAFNLVNEGRTVGTITLGRREFWRGTIDISARSR